MSQFPPVPPSQPPLGMPYAYGLYPKPRPGVITGLSVTAIILGSLGILCTGLGLAMQIAIIAAKGKNPLAPNMPTFHDPAIAWFGAISAAVSLGLSISLLIGGIGGIRLWPVARKAMILWSIVTIVWVTLGLVLQFAWVIPVTAEFMANTQTKTGQQMPRAMAHTVQTIGAVLGWLLWCVLPALFLIFWRSQRVIEAFDPNAQPPAVPQSGWTP